MKLLTALSLTTYAEPSLKLLANATALERQVFRYTYDKDYVYGLKFAAAREPLGEPNLELFELLDKLRHRKLTGQAASDAVDMFAAEHGNLIKLICNKKLNCGIAATTVNKAWPGLIPQFKVQLAKEVPVDKLLYPLYAQLKYDGVRIVILRDATGVMFKTRNGKVIHLPQCAAILSEVLPLNIMIDTEVTIKNGTSVDRTKVSGMINSARCGTAINEDLLVFNAFDMMTLDEFQSAQCSLGYIDRLNKLKDLCEIVKGPYVPLELAETWIVRNAPAVDALYDSIIADGQEGLILKQPTHLYSFKRSADWAKLKEVRTADLQCVDIEEGTGKYAGMIGALVCEGVVEGQNVFVCAGSGLTDLDRSAHYSDYIGHTIEVKYNSIIQDSRTGQWSLFLPRFVCVRFDK